MPVMCHVYLEMGRSVLKPMKVLSSKKTFFTCCERHLDPNPAYMGHMYSQAFHTAALREYWQFLGTNLKGTYFKSKQTA